MKRLILLAHIFLAQLLLADPLPQTRTAVFAGGCFWCIQPAFDKAPGVIKNIISRTQPTLRCLKLAPGERRLKRRSGPMRSLTLVSLLAGLAPERSFLR